MLRYPVAGISLLALATAASAGTIDEDAKAFGIRETIQSMDISPSGKTLLSIVSGPGRKSVVQIIDAATHEAHGIMLADGDPESIFWCGFASDTQIICKYGGYTKLDDDIVGFSRLVTFGVDGKGMKQLGQRSRISDAGIRQFDGDILDWLPNEQGAVLMARNYLPEENFSGIGPNDDREGLGVDHIDLATLRITKVEPPTAKADRYLTDGRGNVRMMMLRVQSPAGQLTGKYTFKYRRAGSRKWEDFSEYTSVGNQGDYPIAVEGNSDSAFVLTNMGGRDALYRVKLDGTAARTLIADNKQVDIASVVRLGNGQKVIGYTYVDDRRRTVYFDEEIKKIAASLAKAVPQQPLLSFTSASADGSKLLVFGYGDSDPGSFYVYDKGTRHLDEIAPVRLELLDRTLASVRPISFPASDGVKVPAYLTLPVGAVAKNLPAIVLPHGGPSARDEWQFDWLAQFLAARGYAVIQPNYRGSDGYGDEWMAKNGFQGWRTSIGDVTAAAKYLVSEGIADPKRLAILGWSYGGYAALQSAAIEPSLYKAAVAIAPVTDLGMLKRDAANFTNSKLVKDFVGSGPHIVEGSPLQRAAEIKVPVLMFHGDIDGNVAIAHSDKMAAALRKAGNRVELVRFKGLDHQLDDSDARIQMLTKIGTFLDQAIGH
jgi:dipeptidyl aminopeptidase/acylaminoacyl peptidase